MIPGLVKAGTKEIAIGVDERLVRCPCCEVHRMADIMIVSQYYFYVWIPVAPIDKNATVICRHCGLTRSGLAIDERLTADYVELKRKFRHPWYTYTIVGLAGILVLAIIITALTSSE